MKKMKNIIVFLLSALTSKGISLLILLAVFAFVVRANFPFDGWLIGWDNVMPEFNFSLNLQRGIFSLWQENQGLGTISGHGFAATIPHTLVMFFLSLIFPLQHLRAVFTFLMLLIGSFGSFFLIKQLLKGKDPRVRNTASLLGALFYMLNLATVQNFYIQLEAFIIHFAVLPWLFWVLLLILEKPTYKRWLLFFFINFLATAQGFIPPLFITYMVYFLILLGVYLWKTKTKESLKRALVILLATGIINAYWFLPILYYTFARSSIYLNAYNNLVTTEEFKLKNKKYGTLKDVAILRGFLFDSIDTNERDDIFSIYKPWQDHWNNIEVQAIGYGVFGIILLGAIYFFRSHRKDYFLAFPVFLLLGFTVLAVDIPPLSWITEVLQNIPVFNQAFRAGFTKFSISTALFYSVFFAIGMYALLSLIIRNIFKNGNGKLLPYYIGYLLAVFISLGSVLYYSLPSLQGNFIYSRLRANLPDSYFQLFNFFKTVDPATRIADLPQGWNWGWSLYRWGYSGSGFLWYGLPQGIMDRNFDVWGNYNENYYWELARAIYADDREQFESIFDKYQIDWVVFDENMIPYPNARSYLYAGKIQELLDHSQKFQLVKTIDSSDSKTREIKIYRVNINSPSKYVLFANNLLTVGPSSKWNNYDKAYQEIGDYISVEDTQPAQLYYPFRSLFTGRLQNDLEFKVEDNGDYFSFTSSIPKNLVGGKLVIPPIMTDEITEIDVNDFSQTYKKQPQVFIDGEIIQSQQSEQLPMEIRLDYLNKGILEIRVPKIKGYYYYDTDLTGSLFDQSPKNCDKFSKGLFQHQKIENGGKNYLRLISVDANNCLDFDMPNLSQRNGYLITVESRNLEGKPLNLAVINKSTEKSDLEISLLQSKNLTESYFIIPPMENYSLGYTVHIDNKSVGREKVINDLGRITVNPLPYRFLSSIKVVSGDGIIKPSSITSDGLVVNHTNPSFYQIDLPVANDTKSTTLVLSQSYDNGWRAYKITNSWFLDSWYMKLLIPFFSKEVKNHVLVNNWENGWQLPTQTDNVKSTVIALIYLPQYLEYIGFALLGGLALYFLISQKRTSRKM